MDPTSFNCLTVLKRKKNQRTRMRAARSRRIWSARHSHNEFVVLLVTWIATNSLPPFAETAETDPKQTGQERRMCCESASRC